MSKRSEATVEVQTIRERFTDYIGKPMIVKFDKFSFPIIITDIQLAKLGALENKPDPRYDTELEKNYRPPVVSIITTDGRLDFILEDIKVDPLMNGVLIELTSGNVEFRIT